MEEAELIKLEEWLKSDEGKRKMKEVLITTETCEAIERMRDIDLAKLREPFTI